MSLEVPHILFLVSLTLIVVGLILLFRSPTKIGKALSAILLIAIPGFFLVRFVGTFGIPSFAPKEQREAERLKKCLLAVQVALDAYANDSSLGLERGAQIRPQALMIKMPPATNNQDAIDQANFRLNLFRGNPTDEAGVTIQIPPLGERILVPKASFTRLERFAPETFWSPLEIEGRPQKTSSQPSATPSETAVATKDKDGSDPSRSPSTIELPSGPLPKRQKEELRNASHSFQGELPTRLHWRFTDAWSMDVSPTKTWIFHNAGLGGNDWLGLTDLDLLQFWRACEKFADWTRTAKSQTPESFEKLIPLNDVLRANGVSGEPTIEATFQWRNDSMKTRLSIQRKADVFKGGVWLQSDDIESMKLLLAAIPAARRDLSARLGEQSARTQKLDEQFK